MKWAGLTSKTRVVKRGERAEAEMRSVIGAETRAVAYDRVRAFDGSGQDGEVTCAGMTALARTVVGDIMRVFRFVRSTALG